MPPVHSAPYRAGPKTRDSERIDKDKMLGDKIIVPARTEGASSIVFAPKNDGTARFCVDYYTLYVVMTRDSFPISRTRECIDSLKEAIIFSTLDENNGY